MFNFRIKSCNEFIARLAVNIISNTQDQNKQGNVTN